MEYLTLSILILVFGAIFTLFVKEEFKVKITTLFTLIANATALLPAGHVLYKGTPLEVNSFLSPIFGLVRLEIDALSAIFIVIIALMSFIGLAYANGYLKPYLNKNKNTASHCFFLMILIASMLGVTVARNGFFFLILWELMSLSSFFLVIFEGEKKEVLKQTKRNNFEKMFEYFLFVELYFHKSEHFENILIGLCNILVLKKYF